MSMVVNIDNGDREYADPPILLTADHDITGATVQVCLGAWGASGQWEPGPWLASTDASTLVTYPNTNSVQVTVLIGNVIRPPSGHWWLGLKLTDTTEVLVRRSLSRVTVCNTGTVTYTLPDYIPTAGPVVQSGYGSGAWS